MMDYYEIGQRIRAARKAAGLSQEQLAEQINISVTHMSHIETGNTKLSLGVLAAISRQLGVRTDTLLLGDLPRSEAEAAAEITALLRGFGEKETAFLLTVVKSVAAGVGAAVSKCGRTVKKYLGPCLLPQAGVAIGLSLAAGEVVPDYAPQIRAVILCGTLIYEEITE